MVTDLVKDGKLTMTFPQQNVWYGLISEMELVKKAQKGKMIIFINQNVST